MDSSSSSSTLFLQFLLLSLPLFYCSHQCSCYNYTDRLSLNQTLKDGRFLISKGGNFTLGFFSPGGNTNNSNGRRYLGIWYSRIPQQTVVWVANRDNPINDSSGEVSFDPITGNLIIRVRSRLVWSADVSAAALSAQLMDTGNLVLFNRRRRMVWKTFDHPTDTILQGMRLGFDRRTNRLSWLSSWRSGDDPGTGDYELKLDIRGSVPQLLLLKKGATVYWRSAPWPWKKYPHVYNYSFENNVDGVQFSYFTYDPSVTIRIVIDELGVLKPMAWHENKEEDGNGGEWKEFWSAPKLRCDLYGHCGEYGSCDPLKVNTFECSCLPGYEPKYPKEWSLRVGSGGCVRKRLLVESSSSTCGGDGFSRVEHVKLPDASAAIWVDMMFDAECGNKCLRNCSCSAYAVVEVDDGKGRLCMHWHGVLLDTTNRGITDGYDLYVRVDAVELDGLPKGRSMLAVLGASVTSAWFLVVSLYLWLRKRERQVKDKSTSRRSSTTRIDNERTYHQDLRFFSLSSVSAATSHFSAANKLGHGGFGIVYKGQMQDGQEVAVKVLSKNSGQGVEEFENEAELIAKLQHRNLVKLLGCCIEHQQQILLYEYLANGSLDSVLFDETRKVLLDWSKRFRIILGIARGILYLHHDSRLRVIHRDLKSSNILLDADMNPKISDFGTARVCKGDVLRDRTRRIVGTYGYMSPEYAVLGHFSTKSDVFSFGVILLEIISGIRITAIREENQSPNLIGHVWELWRSDRERSMEVVDPLMEEEDKNKCWDEILRCIQTALLCVQEKPDNRPDMLAVLLMLNGERTLPPPNQPAFIFREPELSKLAKEDEQCSINQVTITMCTSR